MRAGANGYIMKQEATEKVLVAIRTILQGEGLSQRPADEYDAAAVCPWGRASRPLLHW